MSKTHTRPSPHAPVDPQLPPEVLSWLRDLGWTSRTATDSAGTPVLIWLIELSEPSNDEDYFAKEPLSCWEIAPLMEELIAITGNVNVFSPRKGTPLSAAAHSPSLTRLLLAAGANVHPYEERGNPLLAALFKANREVVTILIEAGADVHTPGTMLRAVLSGDPDMVRFLLEKGVSPNQLSSSGKLSLLQVNFDFYQKTIEVLLDAGADVTVAMHGNSVLTQALSTRASMEMIKRLIDAGALVDHVDISPMVVAANHHPLMIPLLLESGASIMEETAQDDVLSALGNHILNRYFDDDDVIDASREALMKVFQQLLDAGAPRTRLKEYLQDRLVTNEAEYDGTRFDDPSLDEVKALRSHVLAWEMEQTLSPSMRPASRTRM